MRAIKALKAARAVGVDITVDGEDLVLQASAPPPASVLDALSSNKAEIVALLRPRNNRWMGEDCQALDPEQAGIRHSRITTKTETMGIPWAEWKAAALNQLFQEQGIIGEPGRITAATMRLDERNVTNGLLRLSNQTTAAHGREDRND